MATEHRLRNVLSHHSHLKTLDILVLPHPLTHILTLVEETPSDRFLSVPPPPPSPFSSSSSSAGGPLNMSLVLPRFVPVKGFFFFDSLYRLTIGILRIVKVKVKVRVCTDVALAEAAMRVNEPTAALRRGEERRRERLKKGLKSSES